MITLFVDALIALTKTIDRGLSAVEKNVRLRVTPPEPVETRTPTGTGSTVAASAGPGGHSDYIPDYACVATSRLLDSAAMRLLYLGDDHNGLAPELRDRAAYFRAVIND